MQEVSEMKCDTCGSENPYEEFCEECLHRYLELEDEELIIFRLESEEE